MLIENKKEHKYWPLTKTFWKRILFNNYEIIYDVISIATLKFELQASGWGPSMMRIRYKMAFITAKKTKHLKNVWKQLLSKNLGLYHIKLLPCVTSFFKHHIDYYIKNKKWTNQ